MAVKDLVSTVLVVAEARGRAWLSGVLDATYDIAALFTWGLGGEEVVRHGWSAGSLLVIAAMVVGSFVATVAGVRLSRRLPVADHVVEADDQTEPHPHDPEVLDGFAGVPPLR